MDYILDHSALDVNKMVIDTRPSSKDFLHAQNPTAYSRGSSRSNSVVSVASDNRSSTNSDTSSSEASGSVAEDKRAVPELADGAGPPKVNVKAEENKELFEEFFSYLDRKRHISPLQAALRGFKNLRAKPRMRYSGQRTRNSGTNGTRSTTPRTKSASGTGGGQNPAWIEEPIQMLLGGLTRHPIQLACRFASESAVAGT